MTFEYDILVIGAGHAGCEAAAAAANLGKKSCLMTIDMNKIAQMRSICDSINNSNFIVRSFLKWSIKQMLKKSIPTTLSQRDKKEMLKKTLNL